MLIIRVRGFLMVLALALLLTLWPTYALAATRDYTVKWEAERYLTAIGKFDNFDQAIVFGIAGWLVTGGYTSGPNFEENWRIPEPYPSFRGNAVIFGRFGGAENWLSGVVNNQGATDSAALNIGTMTLSELNNPSGSFQGSRGSLSVDNIVRNLGVTNSCRTKDYFCLFMSGPYGISSYRGLSSVEQNINFSRYRATLIPLQWQVAGKVFTKFIFNLL